MTPKIRGYFSNSLRLDIYDKTMNQQYKIIGKRTVLIAMSLLIVMGGWFGWDLYWAVAKATGDSNPLQLVSAFKPAALKETNGRTNILLAGYSDDDTGHQGADLTDSIMVVSINQADKSAVVISIPRDLYVNIPGYGYSKINATYEYGQQNNFSESGYASGGMGLLEKTVENVTGIHFNYEALINYTAFKSAVDAVGGVTVDIQSSNANGLYDPNTDLQLANGTVSLNGQQALNLARARGDGYGSYGFANGDFDRTEHQQQLLIALKDKASSTSVIANPLKVGELASAIGNNVSTDLQLNEVETIYSIIKNIGNDSIKTITLNNVEGINLLENSTSSSGQSILIPADGIDNYTTIATTISDEIDASTINQN